MLARIAELIGKFQVSRRNIFSSRRLMVTLLVSIASRNMSIEDVTTEIRRGRGNRRDFVITADVVTAEKMDQHHLDSLVADVSLQSTVRNGFLLRSSP